MARIAHDREDLLHEATALVPRAMLGMTIQGQPCEVFVGFRDDALSIYFDASPVYHFNATAQLRRAFIDDCLIKADAGRLVGSLRERSPEQVTLVSTPFSADDTDRFAAELASRLSQLRENLEQGTFEVAGQVPPAGDAVSRLVAWLESWRGPRIAAGANII
jgi:hypothetical protein